MKMKKADLLRIVKEEIVHFSRTISEAAGDDDEEDSKKPGPGKPELTTNSEPGPKKNPKDAKQQPGGPTKAPPGGKPTTAPSAPADPAVDQSSTEVPDEEDPADQEMDPNSENPSSGINDELAGKTVQSISIEAKSKLLPGAKEVVISFNETTDPLKILITNSGLIKFYYRGQISDIP